MACADHSVSVSSSAVRHEEDEDVPLSRNADELSNEFSSMKECQPDNKELLRFMRSFLQEADPSLQEADDGILERFLITNSMDKKKASAALLKYLKWRSTFTPLGYVPEDEIMNERKKGKLCLQGYDKMGRTLGVFLVVRHDAFDRDLDEFKRYTVYTFDKAIASTKHREKQVSVIVDLAGWSYRSVDVRGYLALLDILQVCWLFTFLLWTSLLWTSFFYSSCPKLNYSFLFLFEHYLNHLGKIIVIHVPYIFWAAWKVTSPFFNSFTRERMIFVDDKELKSVLLEDIDEDQLPEIYGGKLPLKPV